MKRLLPLLFMTSCGIVTTGDKGGLLRFHVQNQSTRTMVMEVSSELELEHDTPRTGISRYILSSNAPTTILHGFPCRPEGRGSLSNRILIQVDNGFSCEFVTDQGCAGIPIQLSCQDTGCDFVEPLPWTCY